MKTLVCNDYQEAYQYDGGSVLLFNKFEKKRFPGIHEPVIIDPLFSDSIQFINSKSRGVRILISDYYDKDHNLIIKAGTVFYKNEPVVPTQDSSKWEIQMRNSSMYLRGTPEEVKKQLKEMQEFIDERCGKN